MLLTEYAELKWNPHNKNYYESKGYKYTKMKDTFLVKVNDLSDGANAIVQIKCDYNADGCNDISNVRWADYIKIQKRNVIHKDCCNNRNCIELKYKETNMVKYGCETPFGSKIVQDKSKKTNLKRYGVENPFASKDIQYKIKKTNIEKYGVENPILNVEIKNKLILTNIEKYGVENPFASSEIINKIRKTNIKKYGVPFPMQNKEIQKKAMETCINKYGVSSYGAVYSMEHKGELSPTWKGGVKYHRVERSTYEYRHWRTSVFSRDMYICQCCGLKSGKGVKVELQAHHIRNWKDNVYLRYNIDNGITLCKKCHTLFHSKYGKKNNNIEQLNEFLNSIDKKVC